MAAKKKAGAAITSAQVVALIAEHAGVTKVQARATLATLGNIIGAQLKRGANYKVSVSGVGIFTGKARKARMGRNPQTQKSIKIPASTRVAFRAAKSLKDTVNSKKKR